MPHHTSGHIGRLRSGRISATVVIVGLTATLVVATSLMVFLGSYKIAQRNTVELTREKAESMVDRIAERTRDHLSPVEAQVSFVAGLLEGSGVATTDIQSLGSILLSALSATPQVSVLAYASKDLQVVRVFRARPDEPVSVDDWSGNQRLASAMEQAASKEGPFWGELFFAEIERQTFVNLRIPVRRDDQFLGLLIAGVSLQELSLFLSDIHGPGGAQSVATPFILYDDSKVLAHPLLQFDFPGLSDERPLPEVTRFGDPVLIAMRAPEDQEAVNPDLVGRFEARRFRLGGEVYVAIFQVFEDFGERPWTIGTYFLARDMAPQLYRLGWLPIFLTICLFVALTLALLLGRTFSRPLRRLALVANRVREFDFSAVEPLNPSPIRELNQTNLAFNGMVRALNLFALYVPRVLVQRLIKAHGETGVVSEEREVTVMFTDIAGFTSLSERLAAARVAALLNEHFTLLAGCVEAEGGTIDKYIGDALMAFWGAPEIQADSAYRACRAALAISESVEAENDMRKRRGDPPLHLRIGLHVGPVVVGNIGSPQRVDYTIVGDTVNVSQRLEALGKDITSDIPVTILVSDAVREATEAEFDFQLVGDMPVKGRDGAIRVYQLRADMSAVSSPAH